MRKSTEIKNRRPTVSLGWVMSLHFLGYSLCQLFGGGGGGTTSIIAKCIRIPEWGGGLTSNCLQYLPSFPQLPWNSRIFVCFHASRMKWLSSHIFKLNLGRFLPVGQLLPFHLHNLHCILFANASAQKSWKCVSQSHIKKRQKAGRLLSLRSVIFCRLGRRSDANISYF